MAPSAHKKPTVLLRSTPRVSIRPWAKQTRLPREPVCTSQTLIVMTHTVPTSQRLASSVTSSQSRVTLETKTTQQRWFPLKQSTTCLSKMQLSEWVKTVKMKTQVASFSSSPGPLRHARKINSRNTRQGTRHRPPWWITQEPQRRTRVRCSRTWCVPETQHLMIRYCQTLGSHPGPPPRDDMKSVLTSRTNWTQRIRIHPKVADST